LLDELISKGRINTQTWNGTLSEAQLAWFSNEIEAAKTAGQKVIIFAHHPIYPSHKENMLKDEELLPVIAKPEVKAFINGHNHFGNYGQYKHMHCLTIRGMVDTAENAYALAHVYDDHIKIEGHGREPDRTLSF